MRAHIYDPIDRDLREVDTDTMADTDISNFELYVPLEKYMKLLADYEDLEIELDNYAWER